MNSDDTATPDQEAIRRKAELKLQAEMVSIGFFDASKSSRWLTAPELAKVDRAKLFEGLRYAPSPDMALPAIVRLIEKAPAVVDLINQGAQRLDIFRLLGTSEALGDFLIRHPELLDDVLTGIIPTEYPPSLLPETDGLAHSPLAPLDTSYRQDILQTVGANPKDANPQAQLTGKEAYIALRTTYRKHQTSLTIADLMHPNPRDFIPTVGRLLADLAAALIEGALALARAEVSATRNPAEVAQVRLAVMGMGKCGARELNYISDVDVVYAIDRIPAADLPEGVLPIDENTAASIGEDLVQALTKAIMAPAAEPALWEVDANLRPEGKDGALVRTVESYASYYQRWAENWEFQALLKARPIAGDPALGHRWMQAMTGFIWESAGRDSFVESVQAMRARVTDNIPVAEVDRQIKLGPGGLRDVEFTVQLLQLVHGRTDPSVRTQTTTDSLIALTKASYIGRADGQAFSEYYRELRLLEHRIQLQYMRRTHLMPQKEADRRVLSRSILPPDKIGSLTQDELLKNWQKIKRQVRSLHQRLFFRPLLAAVAHLSKDEVVLSPEAAQDRLAALGYKDPRGAMRHIEALTRGVRRSAEIQRTLMPVLLGWFARGVDPDAGLLGFRRISEALGSTSWYLRMLRDSPAAAERLCQILSSSRFIADILEDAPEAIAWLDREEELEPTSYDKLIAELRAQLTRHEVAEDAARKIRMTRRREILRVAMGEASNLLSVLQICQGLSAIDRATITITLELVQRELHTANRQPLTDLAVIAMGRQGGAEITYGSDADLIYVHQPRSGADEAEAVSQANELVSRLVQLLKQPCKPAIKFEKVLEIDADLRPEGKSGPMVRSLESFREYYERWADTWEFQALLRASPIAGSQELGESFTQLIDSYRYPAQFSRDKILEIRRMKARVENERMPRGADRNRQVKLGRGGLSDVEWVTQLLQLCQAHAHPSLQVTGTVAALEAAAQAGLLVEADVKTLTEAWILATKVRTGNLLRTGRTSDVLPSSRADLETIARWAGYEPGQAKDFEEDYLRLTRHCRQVYERLFFDTDLLSSK